MPLQIQIIDGMVGNNPVFLSSPAGVPYQYESGAQASAIVEENRRAYADSIPAKRFRIVKVESEDEKDSDYWRLRESGRFQSGYYEPVPWARESWFIGSPQGADHYCHMSRDKSAMVAFTESEEKGRDDKQKRMRAGRYLTQYFGASITDIEIRHWAGKLSILVGGDSDLLHFATTPDDIEQIYRDGPHSCMAHEPGHYSGPCHPTRIYGAGDLAVAYIERESSIAARVLCYPANKVYSTVYGDGGVWTQQLKDLLESAGYSHSSDSANWDGARLLRVEVDYGNFVIPYFDIPGNATDDGEYLRVARFGDIEADNESGVSEESGRICENCNDRYNDEDSGGNIGDSSYCDSCYCELSFYCEDCEETGFSEDGSYIESAERHVCDSCLDNYPACEDCHERHKEESIHLIESQDRRVCDSCYEDSYSTCGACYDDDNSDSMVERIDGESVCKSCAESMAQCIECDKYDESVNCFVDSDSDSWCGDCRQESLDFEPRVLSPMAQTMESVI